MPKSPLHVKLNGKPPVYSPGSGLAGKPPPPSRAQSVPSKFHASVGSRLNSSFASTASSTTSSDQNVKLDKENVTVTVRFRPLSSKEIQKGDESAWFPNDDVTVCSEYNQAITYSYDKVFGPATTTRQVYDVAAQHVVSGAMEGINGTVFAYGVTSSGKTHTMHGDQKSPGVIPLAIKDIFNIIQETPGREYLLRVSYLEIYNEVINDLLAPVGQNLRIREDANGTYVEGIKQEVVCTPAHVLSLIASGEEHRHVGSNNLNLMSSRSHTIFTLTIETSARGQGSRFEEVTLSQLHLIDLAGSESSKAADTHGVRKKEGSYINKSLLTLGTVISKLTDGKSTHIPYRDSKLTRLLQSSLSGHGRVSLICTVTPSSSSYEETHNTLKFAQRAKHVELISAANKIVDDKSEIKKYQKEISKLKNELEQLKKEMPRNETSPNLKQLEEDHVKLQERFGVQEQEKQILVARLLFLKKLILVSTKNSGSNVQDRPSHRRRYSFGEEELVYLPDKRRGLAFEDTEDVDFDVPDGSSDGKSEIASNGDGIPKEEKKSKKRGMLGWFKHKKHEHLSLSTEGDVHLSNGDITPVKRKLHRSTDQLSPLVGEVFADGRRPPPTGTTMVDEMNLLWESVRILGEEIASSTSSLKRLTKQAASSPDDPNIQAELKRLREDMQSKQQQKEALEARIRDSTQNKIAVPSQMSQQIKKLTSEMNDAAVQLEMKKAENVFLQGELESKTVENAELHVAISTLKKQLEEKNALADKKPNAYSGPQSIAFDTEEGSNWLTDVDLSRELMLVEGKAELNGLVSQGFTPKVLPKDFQSQMLAQANEIEKLKQELDGVKDEKSDLERKCEKLMADAYHAQKLAESAGEDLRLLMARVSKLSAENQELSDELEAVRSNPTVFSDENGQLETDLAEATSRVTELETCLATKEQNEAYLYKQIEEGKQREKDMENDLAGMLFLLAQARSEKELVDKEINVVDIEGANEKESFDVDVDVGESAVEQLKDQLETEKRKVDSLELQNSQLKGDNLNDLDLSTLDDLQNVHVEALTKLYKARTKAQERIEKERLERERKRNQEGKLNFKSQPDSLTEHLVLEEERNGNICKICYESPTAAVLLPCRHFCLCKRCASACKECPICRSEIKDKIITFTS